MPALHWIGKEKGINHHLDLSYRVCGNNFKYFMVFDKMEVDEAHKLDEFVKRIREM